MIIAGSPGQVQNPQGVQLVAQIWSQVHTVYNVQYCKLRHRINLHNTSYMLIFLLTQFVAQIQSPNLRNRDGILKCNFLFEVSGQRLESSQTRLFVGVSALIFPFYKMLFMNKLKFPCFADFFVRIFKTKEEDWFSLKSVSRRDCE